MLGVRNIYDGGPQGRFQMVYVNISSLNHHLTSTGYIQMAQELQFLASMFASEALRLDFGRNHQRKENRVVDMGDDDDIAFACNTKRQRFTLSEAWEQTDCSESGPQSTLRSALDLRSTR